MAAEPPGGFDARLERAPGSPAARPEAALKAARAIARGFLKDRPLPGLEIADATVVQPAARRVAGPPAVSERQARPSPFPLEAASPGGKFLARPAPDRDGVVIANLRPRRRAEEPRSYTLDLRVFKPGNGHTEPGSYAPVGLKWLNSRHLLVFGRTVVPGHWRIAVVRYWDGSFTSAGILLTREGHGFDPQLLRKDSVRMEWSEDPIQDGGTLSLELHGPGSRQTRTLSMELVGDRSWARGPAIDPDSLRTSRPEAAR